MPYCENFKRFISFICVHGVLSACVCVCVRHVLPGTSKFQEKVRSPGIGVADSCEPPCACWKLNSGPLQKQKVFLSSEPSLQLPI